MAFDTFYEQAAERYLRTLRAGDKLTVDLPKPTTVPIGGLKPGEWGMSSFGYVVRRLPVGYLTFSQGAVSVSSSDTDNSPVTRLPRGTKITIEV